MGYISEDQWTVISRLGGGPNGLPPWAREEIDALLQEFHEDPRRDLEFRDPVPEKTICEALALVPQLERALGYLISSKSYLAYNSDSQSVDAGPLKDALAVLPKLHQTLVSDKLRFAKRSIRDRERSRAVRTVRTLLEIEQRALGTALPVEPKDTPTGVRFVEFVSDCTGLSGHELKGVLNLVTNEFARRKKRTKPRVRKT